MKKISGFILTVALALSLMLVPTNALAATTTDVSGQVANTPTVTSITPNNGNTGQALIGVQIIGTNFDAGAVVSFSGTDVTATNITVNSSTNITADVTIGGGAAGGARDVIVTQGGKSGTGTGLFTVNAVTITVTAPSAISLGLMTAGATTYGNSTTAGTVTTNAVSWQVTVKDEKVGNTGYMVKTGPTALASQFQISSDNATFANADVGITYGSVTTLPFYARQAIAQGDAGGSYTITITFTGSVL